jgi:hypothetical protein
MPQPHPLATHMPALHTVPGMQPPQFSPHGPMPHLSMPQPQPLGTQPTPLHTMPTAQVPQLRSSYGQRPQFWAPHGLAHC